MLAETMGCNFLVISSDNVEVINTMNDKVHAASNAPSVHFDCYSLSREFAKVNYVYEIRQANKVAHELARLAKYQDPCTWLYDPPPSIVGVPLLVHDVTLISNE